MKIVFTLPDLLKQKEDEMGMASQSVPWMYRDAGFCFLFQFASPFPTQGVNILAALVLRSIVYTY